MRRYSVHEITHSHLITGDGNVVERRENPEASVFPRSGSAVEATAVVGTA